MLTHLGPFWNKIDRKAEQSDTHQHLVRHNPDDPRRKNKKRNPKDNTEDDLAPISIDSLILFLNSALPQEKPAILDNKPLSMPADKPANPRAYQAHKAYQSAGGAPMNRPAARSDTQKPSLSKNEVNTIHKLIEDLNLLKSNGISSLRIAEGTQFIDSMMKAIRAAKASIRRN